MLPRSRKWLTDLTTTIARLETITTDRTAADYLADQDLRDIVERNLEKIGELVVRLRDHDPATVARIRDFQKIIGLRNVLAHDYEHVGDALIWSYLHDVLPALSQDIDAVMRDDEPPED